jgi:CubicO group peptidase (beta-lactamase class C family)
MPLPALSMRYLRRLIGSQMIRPITQSNWYQPRDAVQGCAQPQSLSVDAQSTTIAPAVLQAAGDYLMLHNTSAFLVMQQGRLVHERYRRFYAHYTFNSMSLVKTVQAICIGIAIDHGLIASVDEPASTYLPEWRNDARQHITIGHLLSMQSGLQSDVGFHPLRLLPPVVRLYLGDAVEHHALKLPAVAKAGEYFEYNNYNTQLLGIVLERASGMSAATFFSRYLWQPLGCHDAHLWLDREGGMARTFGAMFARPEDWLRVGQLFLTRGQHDGQQIVSSAWLDEMLVARNTPEQGVVGGRGDYGYHIWLKAHDAGLVRGIPWFEAMHAKAPHQDASIFYFEGMRGQYVFISPQHELVMLRVGERPNKDWDASRVINQLTQALSMQSTQSSSRSLNTDEHIV